MTVAITLTERNKVDRYIKFLIESDKNAETFPEYNDIKELVKNDIIRSYIEESINLYSAYQERKAANISLKNAKDRLYKIKCLIYTDISK